MVKAKEKRRYKPKGKSALLSAVGPVSLDQFAKWLDAQGDAKLEIETKEMMYFANHPESRESLTNATYWRNYRSVCKDLAAMIRKVRPAPLSAGPKGV